GDAKGVKREGYGKLRLLQLAKNTPTPAPAQMQNKFSDPSVSGELNILRNQGSTVEFGNMLTLPLAGGLIYVQPVYVKAKLQSATPLLRKVLVGYGEKIGFADTLDAAIDQVFTGTGTTVPGDGTGGDGTPSGPSPSASPPSSSPTAPGDSGSGGSGGFGGSGGSGGDAQTELTRALADADAALKAGDEALRAGNWQAYGAAQAKLKEAL